MKHKSFTVSVVLLLLLLFSLVNILSAATITVTNRLDNLNVDGLCTLRESITAANDNVAVDGCVAGDAGLDTIVYASHLSGTTPLTSALPKITESLTINGPGRTTIILSGMNRYRVFTVRGDPNHATVNISGLTIANGYSQYGGGIYVSLRDQVIVSDCLVTDNDATNGAGIYNSFGTVILNNSEVVTNVASEDGGAVYNNGGTLEINDSFVNSNNSIVDGGAIYNFENGSVTITASEVNSNYGNERGGGIFNETGEVTVAGNSTVDRNHSGFYGGGIYNTGTLEINQSSANQNSVTDGLGGAIYNENSGLETLTINSGTITGNMANGGGGVFSNMGRTFIVNSLVSANQATQGGGIQDQYGWLSIQGSTIRDNVVAQAGGGVLIASSDMEMTGTTVSNNQANGGGGILFINALSVRSFSIINSVVSNNSATGNGGGISIASPNVDATLDRVSITANTSGGSGGGIQMLSAPVTITSSMINGNSAAVGGGIDNNNGSLTLVNSQVGPDNVASMGGGISNSGTFNASNVTISGNSSPSGGAGILQISSPFTFLNNVTITNNVTTSNPGGGVRISDGDFVIRNSIIAGNVDNSGTGWPDCMGTITSSMYNLIQDTTGCTINNSNGDIFDQDPLLGVLADNSGPTLTHALLSGSPAIDAGNPAGCLDHAGAPLTRDQRGVIRPLDGNDDDTVICDMGAYELALPAEIEVTEDSDPVDDLSISFNDTYIDDSSGESIVTISNLGQLVLTINNVQLAGANLSEFSLNLSAGSTPCGVLAILVDGNSSCTLGVSFSPQSAGSKSATLQIESDDADEPTVNVMLSGNAIERGPFESPPQGSSSGGCTMRSGASFDPLLPFMLLLGFVYLLRSRGF